MRTMKMSQIYLKDKGFTLIELMIVVAIISILAAISYPMYTDYVRQGKRSEGRAALVDAAARLERFYSDNNVFATAEDTLPAGISGTSENGHYTITIDVADPYQVYTLTASPATFSDPDCGDLTLSQAGARSSDGDPEDNCWGK